MLKLLMVFVTVEKTTLVALLGSGVVQVSRIFYAIGLNLKRITMVLNVAGLVLMFAEMLKGLVR